MSNTLRKRLYMPRQSAPEFMQLKVELRGIEPMIWRRIKLRSKSSLAVLHRAIQASMGWTESHLHKFEKDGLMYGPDYAWDPDFGPPLLSQNKQLRTLFSTPGEWLRYEYDFGDCWVHLIEFEYWLPSDMSSDRPSCVAGMRACPPEDCGGTHGYEHLLKTLRDQDDEYQSTIEWLGGSFDPEYFNVENANERLRNSFP